MELQISTTTTKITSKLYFIIIYQLKLIPVTMLLTSEEEMCIKCKQE